MGSQVKLTLRMDAELIQRAKSWARARGISLSRAVAEMFAQLPEQDGEGRLSSWTSRLHGAVGGVADLEDEEVRRRHAEHVREKHR